MHGVQHIATKGCDIAAVATQHQRCHDRVERNFGRGDSSMAESLAPPNESVLCLEPDEQDLHPCPRAPGKCRMGPTHVERERDDAALDRNYSHFLPTFFFVVR